MPSESVQQILAVFEVGLLLAGAFLLLRLAVDPARRSRWLHANNLPSWPLSVADFAALLVLLFGCALFLQTAGRTLLGDIISKTTDRPAMEVIFYGTTFHVGVLLGWVLFPGTRRRWLANAGAVPAPTIVPPGPRLSWAKVLRYGAGTVLAVFPLLVLLNLGWLFMLHQLGLPDEPQDLIAIFSHAKSPFVIAGLLLVACVIAPLSEELIFRAGLYRFCRQRMGRTGALLICGGVFGAVHANLAGFLPLALLGAGLALAYEVTGDIRVAVAAHGLFNLLNTIFVFSSFPQ